MTVTDGNTRGITIYFAFAYKDRAIQQKLEKQLSALKRVQGINCWHRYLIPGGKEPECEVEEQLRRSDVILLLISPDFLAPNELHELEVSVAMQQSETEKTPVVPIIIRPTSDWKKLPYGRLQALPRNIEQGDVWALRDRDYKHIAEEIGAIVKALQPERSLHSNRSVTNSQPRPLSPAIQGRSKVVQQIYRHLTQPDTTVLVLTGIGGAGKSTLANLVYRYAKKQLEAGKGPFTAEPIWLEVTPSFTIADLITRMFHASGASLPRYNELLPQEQAELLFKTLDSIAPRLIILDQFDHFIDPQTREVNLEHPAIREWLGILNANMCACRILLTSRLNPDIPDAWRVLEFPAPDLDILEGVAFLRKSLQAHSVALRENDLQAAVRLCRGHPLSLSLLASLLRGYREHKNVNLNTLLYDPLYAEYWKGKIASKLLNEIYQDQLDENKRHLLLAFSVFRQPASLEAAGAIIDIFDAVKIPAKLLLKTLAALRNLHLLEDAPVLRCYQLHPIVAEYARDHFDEGTLLLAHAKAAAFYQQQAEKTYPPREQRKRLLDFRDFVEAVWHWCQAKRQEMAYALICQQGLFADLQRCGGNLTLFDLYNMLLPLKQWQPEPLQAAQIYNEYGEIQRTLGHKHEAQDSYIKALLLFQEWRDMEGQVKALNNLGAVRRHLGLLEHALSCYQQALHICDMMETPYLDGKATALNNIGVISFYLGQKERALQFFEQALMIQRTMQDRAEEARTLLNMGRVCDIQKKGDSALQHYRQAQHLFETIGDREGLAEVYNQLGIHYTKRPERITERKLALRQEAAANHLAALRIFQEIGDREQEALTLQRLGRLAFYSYANDNNSQEQEDFREPLAFYVYARQIFSELLHPEKGEITKLVIDELQSRLGAEQLAKLIVETEPRARQIVEQVLLRGSLFTRVL